MKITAPQPHSASDSKLAELILHVSSKCAHDPHFCATKLNKILVFADCISFVRRGKTISESALMRLDQGPVPKRLVPVRERLLTEGRLVIQNTTVNAFCQQHRPVPLDAPDLSKFSAEDIAFVDSVIDHFKDHTATKISNFSHTWPAWQIADDKEEIPIEAAFITQIKPSEAEDNRALELAEEQNW